MSPDKIITTAFIHHLYRSSYFIVSVFRNSANFSITDIANTIENTQIVS